MRCFKNIRKPDLDEVISISKRTALHLSSKVE